METERRCTEVAGEREGKKTAILDKAAETKAEGKAFMDIYLGEESDELDGFEFLTMTEAGEAGHWAILAELNEKAGEERIRELTDWALPLQEGHLEQVREGSLQLAAEEDPYGEYRGAPRRACAPRRARYLVGPRHEADPAVGLQDRPADILDRGDPFQACLGADLLAGQPLSSQVRLDHLAVLHQHDRLAVQDRAHPLKRKLT